MIRLLQNELSLISSLGSQNVFAISAAVVLCSLIVSAIFLMFDTLTLKSMIFLLGLK